MKKNRQLIIFNYSYFSIFNNLCKNDYFFGNHLFFIKKLVILGKRR